MPSPSKAKEKVAANWTHAPEIPDIKVDKIEVEGLSALKAKLIYDKTVTLNEKRAQDYLDFSSFSGERDVSEIKAQLLFNEMRKGTFNERIVTLCTAKLGDKIYKINGQHTCWAVMFMNSVKEYEIEVRELHYEVKDEDQLKQLYAVFDRGFTRTDNHIIKVELVGTAVAAGMNGDVVMKTANGLRFMLNPANLTHKRYPPDVIAAFCKNQFARVFSEVGTFLQNHHTPWIDRQPIVAAMFLTFDKAPRVAEGFWSKVHSGLGFDRKDDPILILRNWLMTSTLGGARGGNPAKAALRSTNAMEMYKVCLHLWNKHRRNECVSVVKPPRDMDIKVA